MSHVPDYRTLLAEFGQRIGLPDLAFDDDGYCCLQIEESVLNIEADEHQGQFLVYSSVGQLPRAPTLAVFRQLAELNYASLMLGKGAIGVDERSGRIMFVERIAWRGLDAGLLETEIRGVSDRIEAATRLVLDEPQPDVVPSDVDQTFASTYIRI